MPLPPDPATSTPWKPTRQQLLDAVNKTLPDVIAPGLRVLFVGINPGLYTAAVGHHFARPGNRFWPALFGGGFTPRLFSPFEEHLLLPLGYGITNVVARATATADQVTADELRAGGRALRRKLLKYRPRIAAVVGVGAYRVAFDRPRATVGRQPDEDRIGETILWLLPNPSGLNAHYQPADLKKVFGELHDFAERLK
jgi:TDG/mug DNA glycosylase family protein